MLIYVDRQEKKPWRLDAAALALSFPDVTIESRSLETGDYTLAGFEGRIALERKGLGDAVNTVVHDWLRFRKELYRLAGMDYAAVVIEATPGQIERGEYESDANPESVLGRLNSIWLDHGIPVLFWEDHETAARMALRFFDLARRKLTTP